MIDLIYQVLQTIINKEQSGYVSPEEFNKLAHLAQQEIFRNYFEDINRDQVKENRGLTSRGFGNLAANERQRLQIFSEEATLTVDDNAEGTKYISALLPGDVYFLDDRGILTGDGRVIEEVSKQDFGYALNSIAYSKLFPLFAQFGKDLKIFPKEVIEPITATYVRSPKQPRWTYRVINDNPLFDPTSPSFQDFELHQSEFANIVLKMLTHFGLNLREGEVMQIAEQLKNSITQKDNA